MNKKKYLKQLKKHLARLPKKEIDAAMDYYFEIIDDTLDDGRTWDYILKNIGTPQEAAMRVINENQGANEVFIIKSADSENNGANSTNQISYQEKPKRFLFSKWYFIFGLITIPLTIAFFAVVLSLAIMFFSLIVSGYAIVIAAPLGLVVVIATAIASGSPLVALVMIASLLVMAGIGFLLVFLSRFLLSFTKTIFKRRRV